MWYIGTMEYYSTIEKEQNYVIYRDVDGPRGCHPERNVRKRKNLPIYRLNQTVVSGIAKLGKVYRRSGAWVPASREAYLCDQTPTAPCEAALSFSLPSPPSGPSLPLYPSLRCNSLVHRPILTQPHCLGMERS